MEHTYCPDLWNGFALSRRGDVFNCCHLKPFRIGNIHDAELRKLANTPEMREYRRKSLNGELECFHRCNLVQKNVSPEDFNTKTEVEYGDLRRLHISFGEACNIRCVMCDHPERHARESIILDSSVVEENIDITPFEDILIQGGEPLFIRSCLDYMAYLEANEEKERKAEERVVQEVFLRSNSEGWLTEARAPMAETYHSGNLLHLGREAVFTSSTAPHLVQNLPVALNEQERSKGFRLPDTPRNSLWNTRQ